MTESTDRAQTTSDQGLLGRAVQATTPRRVVAGLLVLGLVGTGSAAVINYFATVDGSGTVNQAVSVTGSTTVDYAGANAPETFDNQVTLSNNNQEDAVDYTWTVNKKQTDGNGGSLNYINTGVYKVSEYRTNVDFENSPSDNVTVTATPSLDKVTYAVSLPYTMNDQDDHLVDFEVANSGSTDYHIKYKPSKQFSEGKSDFGVKVYNTTTSSYTMKTVQEVDAVQSVAVSSDGKTLTFVVDNPTGKQQFGVRGDYNKGDDSGVTSTQEFRIPQGFDYNSVSTYTESVDTNLVGQEVVLDGAASDTYNFVTEFTEQTGSGDYEVTAKAEP